MTDISVVRSELDDAWTDWGQASLIAKWRKDNPGEAEKLDAYRAGGPVPELATATGQALVHETTAWFESAPTGPSPSNELLVRSIVVPAGSTAYWLQHRSPTTQVWEDGSSGDEHRIIRWASDGLYSGKRMVSLHEFRLIAGIPGRIYDWHTQPDDVGGWTPPGSNGVAPLAIDYWGNDLGLVLVAQPQNVDGKPFHYTILSRSEMEANRRQWVSVWLDVTWGRRPDGAAKAWWAGTDIARVNVNNIHTYWPDENHVTFWEGAYDSDLMNERCEIEICSTRFGRTPQECYEDTPVLEFASSAGVAGGTSTPRPPRLSTDAEIPAPLRWT